MTVALLDLVNHQFFVDISVESLSKTVCLGQPGRINLEKALRAGDRLGGHLVSGHVDGVGHVISFKPTGESWDLRLDIPQSLAMYLVYKGSLTVNGVSLTVNQVQDYPGGCEAHINLIPHTVQSTTLGELTHGDVVNLEVDMLAKYVERLSISRGTSPEMKASQ
ncbi:MAG: Riboflavin synthase [Pseudomonadota bacterium]